MINMNAYYDNQAKKKKKRERIKNVGPSTIKLPIVGLFNIIGVSEKGRVYSSSKITRS